MKKQLATILFLLPLVIFAQNNSVLSTRRPAITAIGKPIGNPASAKIGNSGGSLRSADGKLEVIFPAGALMEETGISIQSISNEFNETNEGAYQLEPSNINFKKPVQLIFHYTTDDERSGIATQNEKGQWLQLKKTEIDPLKKTVSGFVPHFSRWTVVSRFVLKPVRATVQTKGTVKLYIVEFPPPKENPEDVVSLENVTINGQSVDGDLLEPLIEIELTDVTINGQSVDGELLQPLGNNSDVELPPLKHNYSILNWTANGIENGNSEVGTVNGKKTATYQAPAAVPAQNPVAVAVKIKIKFPDGKTKTVSLVSNIKIVGPGYLFTFIHKNFAGCFHYVDSSSCIVRFDSKAVTVSDVTNYKPWSDWDPCTKCNHQYTNKESFKANVEIWGMQTSKVIPASKEKPMTDVYITLLPAFGNTPAAEQQCPRMPKVVIPSMTLPADPKYIHFETDGTDIIVHYMGLTGKNQISKTVKNEETIIKVTKL